MAHRHVIEVLLHASDLVLEGMFVVIGRAQLSLETHNALLRKGKLAALACLTRLRLRAQPLLLQQQRAHVHHLRFERSSRLLTPHRLLLPLDHLNPLLCQLAL